MLAAPAATLQPSPAIAAAPRVVVYGQRTTLSGRGAGGTVALFAQPLGRRPRLVAQATPDSEGRWRVRVRVGVETSFSARVGDAQGPAVVVRVRPRVTLTARGGLFVTRVTGARSFAGRRVYLQRLTRSGWRSVAAAVLRRNPRRFRAALPPGRSRVRIFLPRRQAGVGYLAGLSRPLVVRR